ncbi:hypothetical protein N9H56_05085, partial [Pseudomonadales bacterium]|nr:hypothetical protein [Pseudomonadales bacterium]
NLPKAQSLPTLNASCSHRFHWRKANNPIQAVRGAPIQSSSRKIRFQDEAASATRYRLVNRNK